MIITVCLNPAIDHSIALDHLRPGAVHRARGHMRHAGGKGVNVSSCLADYGLTSRATGFLRIVEEVFATHRLDVLVFPQMRNELPLLDSDDSINETTVSEINIAGLPAVTVPAGYCASGAPFNLVFVVLLWSEADLLALVYDYEQALNCRQAPALAA